MATPAVAQLVRTVLGGPHAEQAVKRQILILAQQNLHLPEVPAALIEALPKVVDRETRAALLNLIFSIDVARLPSIEPLHDALLIALREEKERAVRVSLLDRLSRGLARDPRILPPFLAVLSDPQFSDAERESALGAVASMPAPGEAAAVAALAAAQNAPGWVRNAAVALAQKSPQLTDALIAGLMTFLDPKVDANLRISILRRFAEGRKLSSAQLPALHPLLRNEADAGTRIEALDLLAQIAPWTADHWQLLLWSSSNDGDESVRARALSILKDAPEPEPQVLGQLASLLASDSSSGARAQILDLLRRSVRLPEVRAALAKSFIESAPSLGDSEMSALVDALVPYVGRDNDLRDALLGAVEKLPRASQRSSLLTRLLPKLKVETALPLVTRLFTRERDEALRALLFKTLRPLSLARHPELAQAFCDELLEPGSRLRAECAAALGPAAEEQPEVAEALGEVLSTESERELIRVCLDGYIRPRVSKKFAPLLSVVKNELVDTGSRQRCLEELIKLPLDENESLELAQALSGVPQGTLRVPAPPAAPPAS